jgi:hypothetical protein
MVRVGEEVWNPESEFGADEESEICHAGKRNYDFG